MEALFLYLIKSASLLAAFYLAYFLLLRKETFFNGNRWFLLSGLVTSMALPLLTFKKMVWVDALPLYHYADAAFAVNTNEIAENSTAGLEINWWLLLLLAYAIGIFMFLIKFIFDFISLAKTLNAVPVKQQADFKLVDVPQNIAPFSYFNYIVYNSTLFSEIELHNILEHEKVHCEQKHSVDVLMAQFVCMLFWFNPFVWLYKKAMLQNLEYLADHGAIKNLPDVKTYQITLLKVTTHEHCVAITNHFYQSLIKKRIVMLNKNQSKKQNSWKYFIIVPVLMAFLFYFQVKVIAQVRQPSLPDIAVNMQLQSVIVVHKNTTDAELKQYEAQFKQNFSGKLKFSKIKRNATGEITAIKAQYVDKNNNSGIWQVNGNEPIKPLRISQNADGSLAFGGKKTIDLIKKINGPVVLDGEQNDANDEQSEYAYTYDSDNEEGQETGGNKYHEPIPAMPTIPEKPKMPAMPDLHNKTVVVKTVRSNNGKVVISVNGEVIEVDPEKILADIDLDGLVEQARAGVTEARQQIELRHSQVDGEAIAEAREQLADARRAMADARRELAASREELATFKKELEAQREANKKSSSK